MAINALNALLDANKPTKENTRCGIHNIVCLDLQRFPVFQTKIKNWLNQEEIQQTRQA
jgi:hypothetical protein